MIHSVTMGAPFRWLMQALDVGRRNPSALFGGFLLLMVVGLVPSLIQLAGEALAGGSMLILGGTYAAAIVVSLLLMPPLTGAAFVLLRDCEAGRPARAGDIFGGYRDADFARRMILTAVAIMGIYIVVFALLLALMPGKEFWLALFERMAKTAPGAQPDMSGLPPPPAGFLLWLMVAMAVVLVLSNAYMLAFVRTALSGARPLQAIADGFAGTLKNLLPLIGFTIVAGIVGFIVMLLFALIATVIAGIAALAHPVLAVVVLAPLYFALMLGVYVVSFGFYLHAWREIYGEAPPPSAPTVALGGFEA